MALSSSRYPPSASRDLPRDDPLSPELHSELPATGPYAATPAEDNGELPLTVPKSGSAGSDTGPREGDEGFLAPFGKYELLEVIARGGMGIVYRARDPELGRVVALKTMRTDPTAASDEQVERFRREAQAIAQLNHRHIVPVFEFGVQEGTAYFAMAYVPGGSLAQERQEYRADPRKAAEVMEKVARAVDHAHQHGILHRDLKPSNILLDEDGEPLVADFGLAKFLGTDTDLTQTGNVLGTLHYMSPEQVNGIHSQLGPASDVWALGVMLFELLAGQRPFRGEGREEIFRKILHDEPPSPRQARPGLDRGLEVIIGKCLAKDPARRYASAAELADDLGRWQRGEPLRARPEGWYQRMLRRFRRHPTLTAVGTLLSAFALVLLAILSVTGLTQPRAGDWKFLKAELQARRPVDLIGTEGVPKDYRFLAGASKFADRPAHGAPFTLQGAERSLSMLELLDAPPVATYRIRAQLRSPNTRLGEAGVFLALARRPTIEGTELWYCAAGADYSAGMVRLKLCRASDNRQLSNLDRPGSMFHQVMLLDCRPNAPLTQDDSHEIAVEVTPTNFTLVWDGKRIGGIAGAAVAATWTGPLLPGLPPVLVAAVPPFPASGGMGIYTLGGSASFRRVVVEP